MNKTIALLWFLFIFQIDAFTQNDERYELKLQISDKTEKEIKQLINYERFHKDTLTLYQEMNELLTQLFEKSFLTAHINNVSIESNVYWVNLTVGKQLKWVVLNQGNIDEEVLSKTGYRDKFFNKAPFNYKQLTTLFEKVITYYENNGFPFASIQLDSITLNNNEVEATLNLNKNTEITIDTVTIHGKAKVHKNFVFNYLGIAPGDLYNEQNVKQIGIRIQELPFLQETRPFNVAFTESKTLLNLYLEKRNANRFDGIVGILPDDDDGKIQFVGDVKLRLQNSFHRGELINFNWRKLANKTQDLVFNFSYPYLFNTPFGVDFDFKLYKKDTLFIDINTKYGVKYSWRPHNYFKVFVNDKNSTLLSTKPYVNLTVLPPFADVNSTLYGVELRSEKLNYRLNPRKGFTFLINAEAGSKKIRKNSDLNPEIYEGLQLKSNLYNIFSTADYFIPIRKSMTIKLGNKSAYTFNETAFENELFRIGGLLILRGFDEESIFASLYSVGTFEYRVLLEQNSYWYLFFDGAYYENDNINLETKITDTPFGFGTGATFQTKSGLFSINYALGRQFDNPILFRSAKIHFGFVNYF